MSDSNENPNIGVEVLKAYRNCLYYHIRKLEDELQRKRDYLDSLYERWYQIQYLVQNGITHDDDGHRVDETDVRSYDFRTYRESVNFFMAEDQFEVDKNKILRDIAIISEAIYDNN